MNIDSIVGDLLKTKSYPVGLANKVGYELAIIVYELIQVFGFSFISESLFIEKVNKIAIDKNYSDLLEKELIVVKDGKAAINKDFFDCDIDVNIRSKELQIHIDNYRTMCVKKGKAHLASKERIDHILNQFKNEDDAISAFKYSITNGYTSIFKKEQCSNNRGKSKENRTTDSVWSRGGETNRVREGDKREEQSLYDGFISFDE